MILHNFLEILIVLVIHPILVIHLIYTVFALAFIKIITIPGCLGYFATLKNIFYILPCPSTYCSILILSREIIMHKYFI